MTGGIDPAANADTITAAIGEAASGGASMIFTPEMSNLIDRDRSRAGARIVPEDEDTVLAAVRAAARFHGIWVQLGSIAVRRPDGRFANRTIVVDAAGEIRARYDKLHLFDAAIGNEQWRESAVYAPGDAAVVVDTPAGKTGLSVCYDLRFPALYQALSGAGADLLSIPAAFTRPTGAAHWHLLLRARAIENACFVVAAAQVGEHEDGRATFGHSLVVDPWGDVLLDMGSAAGIGYVEIERERLAEARRRVPVLDHRRTIPAVTRA
jgi:deaminated glutathione amidase